MAEPTIGVRAQFSSFTVGDNAHPTRIVIHATCPQMGYPRASAAGVALSTARYFASSAAGGSAHYIVDVTDEQHCVPDTTMAYHAPPNTNSIGIEICAEGGAYALSYTRAQWLSDAVWPAVVRAAARTRELCTRFGIPTVRLSPADLVAGRKGICGHVDVAAAWHQTDHSDPGDAFPWAEFIAAVNGTTTVSPVPPAREVEPVSRIELNVNPDGTFRETVMVEAGASSAVIARAWLTWGTGYKPAHFDVHCLGSDGKVMGAAAEKHKDLKVNERDYLEVPSGAVMATIAGTVTAGARVGASLVVQPK